MVDGRWQMELHLPAAVCTFLHYSKVNSSGVAAVPSGGAEWVEGRTRGDTSAPQGVGIGMVAWWHVGMVAWWLGQEGWRSALAALQRCKDGDATTIVEVVESGKGKCKWIWQWDGKWETGWEMGRWVVDPRRADPRTDYL